MSEVPEELRARWAAKDRRQKLLPEIAMIALDEEDSSSPLELDELPDFETNSEENSPLCFHRVETSSVVITETMKVFSELSVGLKTLSISNYAPARLSKIRNH